MYREEAEAMRDYLKEYGTFQQQKLAIAEEYAEKIRKAQSQGERDVYKRQGLLIPVCFEKILLYRSLHPRRCVPVWEHHFSRRREGLPVVCFRPVARLWPFVRLPPLGRQLLPDRISLRCV